MTIETQTFYLNLKKQQGENTTATSGSSSASNNKSTDQNYLTLFNDAKCDNDSSSALFQSASSDLSKNTPLFNDALSTNATDFDALSKTQDHKDQVESTLDGLYEAMNNGTIQLDTISEKAVTGQQRKTQNESEIVNIDTEINSINDQINSLGTQKTSLTKSLSSLTTSIATIQKQLGEDGITDVQKTTLKQKLQLLIDEKTSAAKQYSELDSNPNTELLNLKLTMLNASKSIKQNTLSGVDSEIASLEAQKAKINAAVNETKVSIKGLELDYIKDTKTETSEKTELAESTSAFEEIEEENNLLTESKDSSENIFKASEQKFENIFSQKPAEQKEEKKEEK